MSAVINAQPLPGLFIPVALLALLAFSPSAGVEKNKPTSTRTLTSTPTETPTVTPTDSLNVFETPSTPTEDPRLVFISDPVEGSVVAGAVTLDGKTAVAGFSRYEIEFAYSSNPTDTWFLITRSEQPVTEGTLATWDTSSLTDGDYLLRLRVYYTDGSLREILVKGIKVRNYTPTQTLVPSPTPKSAPTRAPTATVTLIPSPQPTPTPLPLNSTGLSPSQVWNSLGRGAIVTVVLFLIFGWLIRMRNRRI